MLVVSRQVAVHGWCGTEYHVRAEVVAARLTELAVAAGHARLDGHAVPHLQVLHFSSDLKKTFKYSTVVMLVLCFQYLLVPCHCNL